MSKDKNNLEIDLSKYKDSTGLSVKKMYFGLWLSENRKKIMRFVVFALIALSVFFFLYSSYNYYIYFFNQPTEAEQAAALAVNVSSQRNIVTDINVGAVQIFRIGEAYDLAVKINNPNSKFTAHMQYCFLLNGNEVNCGNEFMLPSEEKYIFALGLRDQIVSPALAFKIKNISWQRVDAHAIPDWAGFVNQRINFVVEDINLTLANQNRLSEKISLDSLDFKIINRSPFSYYEVPLNIAFYNGSELAGVNSYIIKNFLADETRTIRLSWPGGLSGISRTEIRPNLDLLNESIYLQYQGSQ